MTTLHRGWLICALIALATFSSAARADDPATPAELFAQGRALWEEKRCVEALPLFQQALDATGSPNARMYLARCLAELGRLPEAYDELGRTVADASAGAAEEPEYARTRDQAAAERAQIEARIGRVVIALDESIAGSPVTLNGLPLPAERLGIPMPLMPGPAEVVASTRDGEVRRQLKIGAGELKTITLVAPRGPSPSPAPSPEPPSDTPEGPGLGVVRGIGIGVVALGLAGFAAFAAGTIVADNRLAELEEGCGSTRCTDPAFADTVDKGKRAEVLAGVGLGVGIAGVTAGVLMILLGAPEEATDAALSLAPDGGYAAYRFRF